MTKENQTSTNKKGLYQGILLLASTVYLLSIFIEPSTAVAKNSVSLVQTCLSFLLDILAVFWIRRQIMILSLLFAAIYFNLRLLINPILIRIDYFYTYNFNLISIIAFILAFLIIIIGLWTKIPIKFVRKEFHFKGYLILVPILILTLLIQTISRIYF
ncbi:hypothetical protein PJIAN_4246 [Paludibacter jiangxiensis]|uniref:Uncharacterized protein n=1 Tax=Paludibacter jiangxiensis TaxID=681398 RepID=A0A161LFC1_9BACT|nr:hypothetical protein PJIAN_4246 [Paludibacter jiangxiensis]